MSAKLSLKVENNPDELQRIAAAVEDMAEQEGWAADLTFRANLVIEELVLNIIDYGFDGGSHQIDVTLTSESASLTIEIIDGGKPFNPFNDAPEPDVSAPIESRPVGGLGIYLARTMMDQTDYQREDDKNHLTLVALRN